eukprot:362083-Chlamydomonas_euryale.AAC.5
MARLRHVSAKHKGKERMDSLGRPRVGACVLAARQSSVPTTSMTLPNRARKHSRAAMCTKAAVVQ